MDNKIKNLITIFLLISMTAIITGAIFYNNGYAAGQSAGYDNGYKEG